MQEDDRTPGRVPPGGTIIVGQELAALSEHELETRIDALRAEITRTEETLRQRRSVRDAAEAFFKT
ncbi:DUF1192 domain-containing protein [Roseibium aestuarii]|uniref:DUF1192 domain-containing protein n=1 Tax=Roseibium aestuarii TaxID=2600299 RepID=A0ABW4JZQ1_9HYPH|nr:DUF1192 domain-containing protein [Roseibium aestuarii]